MQRKMKTLPVEYPKEEEREEWEKGETAFN